MSKELEEAIRTKIKEFAKDAIKKGSTNRVCTVSAIDEDAQTFDAVPLDGGPEIYSVRINAILGGDGYGLTLMPDVKSTVIVGMIDGNKNNSFLVLGTDFKWLKIVWDDKTWFKIDSNGTFYFKSAKMQFNDGANGGLINIASIVAKLNNLEAKLASHQHTYVSPTGPLITTLDPLTNTAIPLTQQKELEDTKITH